MKRIETIRNYSAEDLARFLLEIEKGITDEFCFEICTKETGDKFTCPHGENPPETECVKCLAQWLETEGDVC